MHKWPVWLGCRAKELGKLVTLVIYAPQEYIPPADGCSAPQAWSPMAFLRRAVQSARKLSKPWPDWTNCCRNTDCRTNLIWFKNLNQSTPEHTCARKLPSKTEVQTPESYLQNVVKTKRRKGGVRADTMSSFLFAAGERHNSLGVGFENMRKKDIGPF